MNYEIFFEQLRIHEGCKLKPYQCSQGYMTIGIGRNLETNSLSKEEQLALFGESGLNPQDVISRLETRGITIDEAEYLFTNDVEKVETELCERMKLDGHSGVRQAVLLNMGFQLGVTGLFNFKNAISAFESQDYEECAKQMLDSLWARQTPKRAEELAGQMRSDEWAVAF